MPRYFFHAHDGVDYIDENGVDLPSLAAARIYAVTYAAELLRSNPEAFWSATDWQVNVADESGLTLFYFMLVGIDATAGQKRTDDR